MSQSRFIIATLLPKPVSIYHAKLVDEISDKFSLRKIDTPSHITLKDSFYTEDTNQIEEVISYVIENKMIKDSPSINVGGIENFRNEIYYLNATLNSSAKIIHKNLMLNLKKIDWLQWDQFDSIDRKFHVTITNKANQGNYQFIQAYLDKFNERFSFSIDNICLLKKLEEERKWIVYKEFKV